MAEPAYRVELTASFLERLESIEALLQEADAPLACDALLAALRDTVIPNLRRFPRMGRRYLDQPPQSAEAIAQLSLLPAAPVDALRVLGGGDYLILYAEEKKSATVHLLSIRHHRQLSFDFARLWPGPRRRSKRPARPAAGSCAIARQSLWLPRAPPGVLPC